MRRREVVRFLGAALALPFLPRGAEAAIKLGESLHARLGEGDVPFRTLNAAQQALVTNIAELIIPETDTPGATRVKVPEFIDLILTEWASTEERDAFLAGLAFARLKALTVYGYFTSMPVQQDILKTQMFFNGYDGNVPFTPAV